MPEPAVEALGRFTQDYVTGLASPSAEQAGRDVRAAVEEFLYLGVYVPLLDYHYPRRIKHLGRMEFCNVCHPFGEMHKAWPCWTIRHVVPEWARKRYAEEKRA